MTATKGKGAKFHLWDAAALPSPALRKVGDVLSLTPPSASRDTIDTTTHDSTGDYREFIASLIDAGEATILINHNPGSADDEHIQATFAAGEVVGFAIDLNKPGSATQQRTSGSCIVTQAAPADVVIDDKMTQTVTLKVSGPLTFGDAPAP
jgi:predicted secreted protein